MHNRVLMVQVFTIPMEILFVKRNEDNVFVFLSLNCFILFFEHFEPQKRSKYFGNSICIFFHFFYLRKFMKRCQWIRYLLDILEKPLILKIVKYIGSTFRQSNFFWLLDKKVFLFISLNAKLKHPIIKCQNHQAF